VANEKEPGAIDQDDAGPRLLRVRHLERGDRVQWRLLWQQYLPAPAGIHRPGFYLQRPPDETMELTFERLVDPAQQPHALVAVRSDRLVGFVHYLFHASSWSVAQVCYLEDLYVEPRTRRAGVGRALVRAVYAASDQVNVSTVYWLTQESNSVSRALFETMARRTDFIRYER
jgi:GNAT superfamily N-acetyltransferase